MNEIPGTRVENGMVLFWGSIFSNFHPCQIKTPGVTFNCSEQYFMYYKALHFNDVNIARQILAQTKPGKQKALGRKVKGFDEFEWSKVRYGYMLDACRAKFEQNRDLCRVLLSTYPLTLVEASEFDDVWGIKLGMDDPLAWDKSTWRGLNLLGQVLMEVREEILKCQSYNIDV